MERIKAADVIGKAQAPDLETAAPGGPSTRFGPARSAQVHPPRVRRAGRGRGREPVHPGREDRRVLITNPRQGPGVVHREDQRPRGQAGPPAVINPGTGQLLTDAEWSFCAAGRGPDRVGGWNPPARPGRTAWVGCRPQCGRTRDPHFKLAGQRLRMHGLRSDSNRSGRRSGTCAGRRPAGAS